MSGPPPAPLITIGAPEMFLIVTSCCGLGEWSGCAPKSNDVGLMRNSALAATLPPAVDTHTPKIMEVAVNTRAHRACITLTLPQPFSEYRPSSGAVEGQSQNQSSARDRVVRLSRMPGVGSASSIAALAHVVGADLGQRLAAMQRFEHGAAHQLLQERRCHTFGAFDHLCGLCIVQPQRRRPCVQREQPAARLRVRHLDLSPRHRPGPDAPRGPAPAGRRGWS